MTEATKERKSSAVFEEVFQNIRKAAETGIKMQQEMLSQWSVLWPGVPTPQSAWLNQVQQFRTKFGHFPPWAWNNEAPVEPSLETRRWIRSKQIAWLRARNTG